MGWDARWGERIANGNLTVGVVGLGYVGLPTALGFLEAGFSVRGIDVSERTISELAAGNNPGDDPQHDDLIPSAQSDSWRISTDYSALIPDCDVVLVTVPTPVGSNQQPDLSFVASAGASVFDNIAAGSRTVVVLESTVYPGVTREIWTPLLAPRGLKLGIDVEFAYCPERFVPGDPEHGVRQVPRVVGANSPEVGDDLRALYETLTSGSVTYVGEIEVAEAAKIIENVQRDLNIALVNELARIFPKLGLDVEDVLSAAATKWNFHRYSPGIGVGGHCIPVDPYYLIQKAKAAGAPIDLITSARAVNRSMPKNVANDIIGLLGKHQISVENANVLLLGWSYKPGIADMRETPAEPLSQALATAGCQVQVIDPYIEAENFDCESAELVNSLDDVDEFDFAILVTAHDSILAIDWADLAQKARNPLIYDGRRVVDVESLEQIGWTVYLLGAPL